MDTITRQDLVQLGYKSETSRKIIAQAKSILIKRGYIFYDNKRLGRVPVEVVEEILGLHIKLGA
ncbi:DUF3173 domain-containing protein [Lactococcus raffinolactis]|jgi:hypothetical protein|uniref:DUF3173 domain-containing protein n=1 Tax=Pseudolactococcus raffinolactis TaxID=1366 RepID=A0A6H0UC02_9LACT|nr:DUF3173 domain-containing protein [Lactococcus raffinolactis]NMC61180.1 DUF3173 family protein [Candidatus Methanofastidiosa archaeon]QIW53078.1 DUF3173 domain-containing protein [Lactococcus raffinolactis]QIW56873.1 DUF3173 family protein [Lactococcus raffinolactis]